jgi:hypothetical protein
MGAAALGLSGRLREREPTVAGLLRLAGAILLFYAAYSLGFYHHWSATRLDPTRGSGWLPAVWLGLGAAVLAVGLPKLAPGAPELRRRLAIVVGLLIVAEAVALAADLGAIPRGREFSLLQGEGPRGQFDAVEIAVAVGAWAIWFVGAFWCVSYGGRARSKLYLNAGAAAVGIGVVTRFFDAVGGMTRTGVVFVVGGLALVATAGATERWRRKAVARMEEKAGPLPKTAANGADPSRAPRSEEPRP